MKIQDTFDLSRSEWENLIDEWVFRERDRAVLMTTPKIATHTAEGVLLMMEMRLMPVQKTI